MSQYWKSNGYGSRPKGRGKGRAYHSNNYHGNSGHSYDLPEFVATKSGKWERGCDKMRLILNQEKLSALMKGEADILVLPTVAIQRLRQLLESTPITASAEEWQQFGMSMTSNKVLQSENDIWTMAGYHITETIDERMQAQAQMMQTQTQALNTMAENQTKMIELLQQQQNQPSGAAASPPRKTPKGRGRGRGQIQ